MISHLCKSIYIYVLNAANLDKLSISLLTYLSGSDIHLMYCIKINKPLVNCIFL